MILIYFVVSVIMAAITYVCSQLDWHYGYILMYIFMFLTSWFISLMFVHQEEFDRSKKYTLITPGHLIFLAIDICLLIYFWKWHIKDFQTVRFAKYKLVVLVNLIQGSFLMLYYKLVDFYTHL